MMEPRSREKVPICPKCGSVLQADGPHRLVCAYPCGWEFPSRFDGESIADGTRHVGTDLDQGYKEVKGSHSTTGVTGAAERLLLDTSKIEDQVKKKLTDAFHGDIPNAVLDSICRDIKEGIAVRRKRFENEINEMLDRFVDNK